MRAHANTTTQRVFASRLLLSRVPSTITRIFSPALDYAAAAAVGNTRIMATEKTKMADGLHEPLFGAPAAKAAAPAAAAANVDGSGFSWLTALGFLFLTFNSGMAIYRSDGDVGAVAFVVFSYVDLVLLFCCLRWFERAEPGSAARGHLKGAVWVLTTLLTVAFSFKVAAIMPFTVQILVWGMAAATVLGGFYAFFLHSEPKDV